MHVDWDPLHLSLVAYTYLYLFHAGIDKTRNGTKIRKSCFRCKKNTWHVESNYLLQPPKYLVIAVNRFRYINNNFTKDRCSIPMDVTVVPGLHKSSLQGYHRSSRTIYIFWPLYCLYQLLQKKILLQRQQNYGVWNDWYQKLLYCLCGNV